MSIVRKQRQALAGLRVTAESVREDAAPWRFQKIHIVYRFSGHQLNGIKMTCRCVMISSSACSRVRLLPLKLMRRNHVRH